jgi:hypothetical protein
MIESNSSGNTQAVVPVRLSVKTTLGEGRLDGAWWPRSRDLTVELQALADQWPQEFGRIARVLYSDADWENPPRRIYAQQAIVPAASFPHEDTHELILTLAGNRRRVQLLVIPADATAAEADDAFAAAAQTGTRRSANEILTAPEPEHAGHPATT